MHLTLIMHYFAAWIYLITAMAMTTLRWSLCVRSLVECMAATAGCGVVQNKQRVRLHSLLEVVISLTLMRYFLLSKCNSINDVNDNSFFYLRSMVESMAGTAGCGAIVNKQGVRLRLHWLFWLLPVVLVLEVIISPSLMRYFGVQIHYNQWQWRLCVDVCWLICWMYGTAIVLTEQRVRLCLQ